MTLLSDLTQTFSGNISLDGAVTINESGANVDFRVEGDTDPNLLFVDASADKVGIGTSSPANTLSVNGSISANTIEEYTSTYGVHIKGATDGVAIPTGYIGERIVFTSRTVTTIANSWAGGTSSLCTLTKGIWAVYGVGITAGGVVNVW